MREIVAIWYRGASYQIGRGRDFYGIWPVDRPAAQPLEWWPLNREGWSGAWSRFTGLEAPGTIVPSGQVSAVTPAQRAAAPAAERPAPPVLLGAAAPPAAAAATSGEGGPAPSGGSAAAVTPSAAAARPSAAAVTPSAAAVTPSAASVTPPAGIPVSPVSPAAGIPAAWPGTRGARRDAPGFIAAALLAAGVALGTAGLFPAYLGGASLAVQPDQLVPHVIYLAAWTASAVLILLGGVRRRMGALAGAGISVVTFGLFFADLGTVIAGGTHLMGAGLALSLIGWLGCAAGSATALWIRPPGEPGWSFGYRADSLLTLGLAGLGAAIAFAPSWDSYTLHTAAGASQTVTAGNAFANPAPVIAGDVAVMVALVAAVVTAALWRPARYGAALLAGAIIPMAAQAISALVQIGEAVPPAQFGIPPAQAAQAGLTISSGLTPAFWIYCAFIIVLAAACAWMFLRPGPREPEAAHSRPSVLGTTPPASTFG